MAKALCSACNELKGQVKISDGVVCKACYNLVAAPGRGAMGITVDEIQVKLEQMEKKRLYFANKSDENQRMLAENRTPEENLVDIWTPTKAIGTCISFDEEHELFKVFRNPNVFRFSEIVGYEIIENGSTVTKGGLGGAVVGGALLGGVGAIVGGVTGKRATSQIISNMTVKIIIDRLDMPAVYIPLIAFPVKAGSMLHVNAFNAAHEVISALTVIRNRQQEHDEQLPSADHSAADEIAKFKKLLDKEIITQKEFETKKKQLLGI